MTFRAWMDDVDQICLLTYGMSIYDLPDMAYYDAFDSGQSPEEFMLDTIPDLEALKELVLS